MKNVFFVLYLLIFSPALLLGVVVFGWKVAYQMGQEAMKIALEDVR